MSTVEEERMRSKGEMVAELQTMLRDVLEAAAAGTRYTRIARAHGYVDGYMRALLDLDVATRDELIEVVAAERERVSGPAVAVLGASSEADEAAA
jgi:hypothetical protein